MGMIDDIMRLVRKGPEMAAELNSIKLNNKSVVRGANEAVFQFPCLISDTIPIDYATTITRMLERTYADYTQTWISANSIMDITLDPSPISYLKRIHQNVRLEHTEIMSDDKGMDYYIERAYDGKDVLYLNNDETFGIMFSPVDRLSGSLLKEHAEELTEFLSEYNLNPIVTEADSDNTNAYDLAAAVIDGKIKSAKDEERSQKLRESDRIGTPKLLERDVKKSNDMSPLGIQVRLIGVNDKKEFVQYFDIVIGIKAVMHLLKSDEIMDNIQRALQNKSLFFKYLRWTSGEISLVKDMLLNINDIKWDAMNRSRGRSPWFGTLKRLKQKKIGVRNLTVPHSLIPNATVIISNYEADYLANHYAIDIRNASITKKIIDSLFLVGFVIIDDASGTVDVLYDGDSSFQTYSIEMVERANDLSSNKLGKEIGRMISH